MAEGGTVAAKPHFALVGCGGFGRWVSQAYVLKYVDLVAFCDPSVEAATAARDELVSARTLLEAAQRVGGSSADSDSSADAASAIASACVYLDFEALVAAHRAGGAARLDGIFITTSNDAHCAVAVAAAEAGLHIFCEKVADPEDSV